MWGTSYSESFNPPNKVTRVLCAVLVWGKLAVRCAQCRCARYAMSGPDRARGTCFIHATRMVLT